MDATHVATESTHLDWNDVPILLSLARDGSMSKASRRLGVNTSTISRRIAAAEAKLQTRLFVRGPDGYKPTDAGRTFLAAAEEIESRMYSLVTATQSEADKVAGSVRITSVDSVLNDWLIPRVGELLKAHPQLQLAMLSENHVLSFTRSEADLALRVARPKEDAAILMRRVGSVGMAVFGVRRFKKFTREQWAELPWLSYNEDLADAAEMKWLRGVVPDAKPRFRCSSMTSLIQACEAGLGLAVLPCFAIKSKWLQQLSPGPEYQRDLYLLSHRDASKIRRFRAVADWIAARAESDAAILSGKA